MPNPASAILLTPTNRLARSIGREQAFARQAAGAAAWMPVPVLTFDAWYSRLQDDYLLQHPQPRLPLNAQQSQLLWQSLIDYEVFVGEPEVARLAQRAWRAVHEYQLPAPGTWPSLHLTEDSRRFVSWSGAFEQLCAERGLLDEWAFAALLPELFAQGHLGVPSRIELRGFDLPLTPLQQKILDACEAHGCDIIRNPAEAPRPPFSLDVLECVEADDELFAAARWARGILERAPQASVAVVIPDLQSRVDAVDRIFRRVFDPPAQMLGAGEAQAWHVSLGKALASWPLVEDALAVLSLQDNRLTQPQAMLLLRSPFLWGAQAEASARQQVLITLLRRAPYALTLNEFCWALQQHNADNLAQSIEQWRTCRQGAASALWAAEWAAQFTAELAAIGFGHGRALNSREYQSLERWHGLLEAFSSLDMVLQAPLNRNSALSLLRERARQLVFRERNEGCAVEVLGVEEALGSRFDALWLTTLDSETWPGASQRDPLIPAVVQTPLPRSSSDACLRRAEAELQALTRCAPLIEASFSKGSEEPFLEPARLLQGAKITHAAAVLPPASAPMMAPEIDNRAPALADSSVGGGTTILRHQAVCGFRAFAEHRLGAAAINPPRPGLNAGQRGTIVHQALEYFWAHLSGHADLIALSEETLSQNIERAVTQALADFTRAFRLTLSQASHRLELTRIQRILVGWLHEERKRPPFKVIAQEYPITMRFNGVTLTGKLDRLDELADGSRLLLDYKTGRSNKSGWFPAPRMHDPQLPAYAVCMQPPPAAIGFARLRPDDLGFDGLAAADTGIEGIGGLAAEGYSFRELAEWSQLLDAWQTHLDALAAAFAAGDAAVDPREPNECQHCHLHGFCRVQERAPFDSLSLEQDGE